MNKESADKSAVPSRAAPVLTVTGLGSSGPLL